MRIGVCVCGPTSGTKKCSNWVWYDPDVQGVGLCMDQKPSEGLGSVWTNKCSKSCLFFVYMCWCSVSFLARVDVFFVCSFVVHKKCFEPKAFGQGA